MNDAPENVRLIGGEMLLWSDMSNRDGITDWRGAALELISRMLPPSGRVLLVGPHPQAVVDQVAAHAPSAAVLLRSYPDACALGERHPGLAVYCGRLEVFAAEEPYDLVLALDGLLRTHSAEAPAAAWIESLDALAAHVAPGGRLVLGVRNDLGVDRFLEARPAERDGGDDQWAPHGFDPSYPSGPGALDAGLESAGLTVQRCYAAYPGRQAPRALLAREALAFGLPDALTFPLSAGEGDRMLVADPLHLTRLVFRHRLGEELAPLWLAVATRPLITKTPRPSALTSRHTATVAAHDDPADADVTPHGDHADAAPYDEDAAEMMARDEPGAAVGPAGASALPLGLLEDGAAVYELTRAGLKRLPNGEERPIPTGRVVEEILVEACAREDVKTVRDLLSVLATWLEKEGGDAAAATDGLVYDGERFTAVTPGAPAPATPPDPRIALCRILWRFAVRLQAAGHHHPWPWPLDADQLTLTLCGMAGRPCDPGDLDLARKLDAELGHPTEPAAQAPTYRDLLGARDRLADQLTAALARVARLETKLSYRERELVRAKAKLHRSQRKATAYRRTLGYRLSRRLARPRKVARKVFRLLSG
ncbi:hypothetical protein [Nonomuraea sp. SYSU D8015]|uniref:hypothetical protein n=1 Tax=Nonomuraea sp. SYSU D8015 TaxID=2593644 RepID=UPI0016610CBC|nr:hypothetical protein [Nonomuraea sp. SYSU D8015]